MPLQLEKGDTKPVSDIRINAYKNHQTINNEIKRGSVIQRTTYGKFKKVYKVEFAQIIYDKNKRNCGRKLKVDYVIRDKVIHYLKYKHSP